MEFVSTRIRRWIATILLLSIVALCFAGCTLRDTSIFSKEITMQCDDPYMVTTYKNTENGVGSRETYLEIDGELQKVALHYREAVFGVYWEFSPTEHELLLFGTWKEKDGNLILYIDDDYIFDNKYEKIVLKPVENSSP